MLFEPAATSAILAFITTLHLAGAALRNHRSATHTSVSSLTLVSLAFAGMPWVFSSPIGLGFGLAVHSVWFLVCERLGTSRANDAASRSAAAASERTSTRSAAAPARTAVTTPTASKGFVQTPVLATVDETSDIRTIRMLRPEGFAFEAGQFIPIRIRVDGKEYVRCYSISSSPHSAGFLEVSIKRQGIVSNALHATARPGSILSIKAPNGAFKYPAADDRPLVLLAGGVGITPMISMLRRAVHTEPARRVTVVYSAADAHGFAFRDELDSTARRHPQVKIVYCLTRQPAPDPAYYPGRVDAVLLKTAVPDITHSISFICGPAAMIDGLKSLLTEIGVPAPQIRHELFEAAVAAAAGAQNDRRAAGNNDTITPGAATGRALEMKCLPDEQIIPVERGQSLLEAAESGGVDIPSLCRAGVCGTCRVRVTEGDVDCDTTTLDERELGQGYVLACVAQARTNCTVQR